MGKLEDSVGAGALAQLGASNASAAPQKSPSSSRSAPATNPDT